MRDPEEQLKDIAFSILASPTGARAISSWRVDADAICSAFVNSLLLLSPSMIPHAVVRFAASEFENVFFRPSWWESLSPEAGTTIEARFMHGVDPRHGLGTGYVKDAGVRAVDWHMRGVLEKRE
jgi:hypothetical protein